MKKRCNMSENVDETVGARAINKQGNMTDEPQTRSIFT